MRENKFLIIDTSGFNPIRYSITEGDMAINDLTRFSVQANLQLCITSAILQSGEFSYSKTPDLFTYTHNRPLSDTTSSGINDQLTKSCWLTLNGTMTIDNHMGELEVKVLNIQTTQTNSSNYLSKLSPQDISNISLANELLESGSNVAILVNDWHLREQAKVNKISVYGTCSFLAGMVLNDIYTYQKTTKLHYKWKEVDKKWVPRDFSFKDVLHLESDRNKERKSFWFNYG